MASSTDPSFGGDIGLDLQRGLYAGQGADTIGSAIHMPIRSGSVDLVFMFVSLLFMEEGWMLERIEVTGILDLLLAGVSGGAIYIAGLFCLRAFSFEEMRNWRSLLQPGHD